MLAYMKYLSICSLGDTANLLINYLGLYSIQSAGHESWGTEVNMHVTLLQLPGDTLVLLIIVCTKFSEFSDDAHNHLISTH